MIDVALLVVDGLGHVVNLHVFPVTNESIMTGIAAPSGRLHVFLDLIIVECLLDHPSLGLSREP